MGNNNCGSVFAKVMVDVACPADVVAELAPNASTPETRASAVMNVTAVPVNQNPPFAYGVTLVNSGRAGTGPGGFQVICAYEHNPVDATEEAVAAAIAASILDADNGYGAVADGTAITITDIAGNGDSINGSNVSIALTNALPFIVQNQPFQGGVDPVIVNDNLQLQFTAPANAAGYKARVFTSEEQKVLYYGMLTPGNLEIRTIGLNEVVDPDIPYYVELKFLVESPSQCLHEIVK